MKSAVETLSPTRAKLTVEVPFEELKPSLDAAYQQIAKQINVPGFRKGKVPPSVIDRQVGKGAILEQAINDALPQKYREALEANSLEPLAQPDIEVTKLDENEGFEFTAEVDVKPDFELPAYDGVTASVDDAVVADADVEEQLAAMRERFGTLSDVERPAQDGDFVVIDLTATQDGQVLDGAELTGMSYRVGRGGMVDGLDEASSACRPATRRPSPPSSSAATSSARRSRSRSRSARSRSRSCPSWTTTSPRTPPSSTRLPSWTPTCASGSGAASASSRPPPRATPSWRRCSRSSRSRCRTHSSPTS